MSEKQLPSPELLRQLLRYEPDTGKLFWFPRPVSMFPEGQQTATHNANAWNNKNASKEAFSRVTVAGYHRGAIFNRLYMAHRVIWAHQNNAWPTAEIDHVDGNPGNNRIANLRHATRSENARNTKSKGQTSQFLGVCFVKGRGKWRAEITVGQHREHLGYFEDEKLAALAYDASARKHFGEFARPNFPTP
jgi:hypothetical protein